MTMPSALASFQFKKKGGPATPVVKAAASAKLAPPIGSKRKPFGGKQAPPFGKSAPKSPGAAAKGSSQPQLGSVIASIRSAAAAEPEPADKAKLNRAAALVEQVQAKNAKEG